MHFTVMSHQKALSDIYSLTGSWELSDFPEELHNLSEATMRYNFKVTYVPGKKNMGANFLSRTLRWSSTQSMAKEM